MSNLNNVIADLAKVAAIVTAHPELGEARISEYFESPSVSFNGVSAEDSAAYLAEAVRLFPGVKFHKNDPDKGHYDATYYRLTGMLGTVSIELWAFRSEVCERVVTGSKTVTEELPDPDLVAKLPTVKTERVVETFEWQCVPLLAKAEAAAA